MKLIFKLGKKRIEMYRSSIRELATVDFVRDVNAFVLRIESPAVHLNLAQLHRAHLPMTLEGRIAHSLLRCSQEIVTNAVRHAGASNLWIQGAIRHNHYELHAHDDGKGSPTIEPGNGLAGMEERIRELQGELLFSSAPERGFQVSIRIPLPQQGKRNSVMGCCFVCGCDKVRSRSTEAKYMA